jgi:hypothetical protein
VLLEVGIDVTPHRDGLSGGERAQYRLQRSSYGT